MASEEEEFEFRARAERERGLPKAAPAEARESPYSFMNLAGAAIEPNLGLLTGSVATPISGLAGMLGGMLPGPQGQSADWQRATQGALTWLPQTEGGKTATSAISYPFRKFGEATNWAGEKTAEATGSPALGAAVKTVGDVGVPAALAASLRNVGGVIHPERPPAEWLMRKAVKPSATTPRAQSDAAIRTMLEEGISHSPSGMDKTNALVRALNAEVEQGIANSPATVNVARVGASLRDPYKKAQMQVNPAADTQALRGVWDEFRNSPNIQGKTEIPVQLAHELKKGTYRALGDKAYGELKSASTEGQKSLARGLREQVAANVPGVVTPLKREAALFNVLDVAEQKVLSQMNNNPAGLALLAGDKKAFAAFLADRSAPFKSAVAHMLYQSGNPQAAAAALASAGTGQTQNMEGR